MIFAVTENEMSRYIDADEAKKKLREYCIDGDEEAEYWFDIMGIESCIDNIVETADVRENVRGEWLKKEKVYKELPNDSTHRYECSICGWSDQHDDNIIVPFCWHCGADMRGGKYD